MMRIATYVTAIVAVTILASCTQSSPSTPNATTTHGPPKPVTFFQKGVQVNWHTKGDPAYVAKAAKRSVDYAAGLGANSIGITTPIYVDGDKPTTVYAGERTPSPNELGMILDAAKASHLRTMVRPLVDDASVKSKGATDKFRGKIEPVDVPKWFADYARLLDSYVPTLIDHQVDEFVLGTELVSLQNYPEEWQKLYDHVKESGYQGVLSFALNWDDQHTFTMPFETWGVDAYPKTTLDDEATVPQIQDAITGWLNTIPTEIRHDLTFQEVGLAAQISMYKRPWNAGSNALNQVLRPDMQAKWFVAMCNVAKQNNIQGIYYWVIDSNKDPASADPIADPPKSWIGRPAEQVVRDCFATP